MDRKRVVFLGNHDVGLAVLEALRGSADLVGIVAHPEDPEDGVRYGSVFEWAKRSGIDAIRGKAKSAEVEAFVRERHPDLLVVADYRYLLPKSLLDLVGGNAVNFHPSLLPRFRGRAPINWAIIEGEDEIGLTAHFIDDGVDTGDILMQRSITLSKADDVGDALARLVPLYAEMAAALVRDWDALAASRKRQPAPDRPPYPARRPQDGLIDWNQPADRVHDFIRALAKPYPGAFSIHDEAGRIVFWKARPATNAPSDTPSGTVVACNETELVVACDEGALSVNSWSDETGGERPPIPAGSAFETEKGNRG